MARTRSMESIDAEIQQIESELTKLRAKQDALEGRLLELQKTKQEIETRQIMEAFKRSGKTMHELLVFLED